MKKYNVMGYEMAKMEDVKWCIRRARRNIDLFGDKMDDATKDYARFILDLLVHIMYVDELRAAASEEEKDNILETTGDFVVYKAEGKGKDKSVTYFEKFDNGEAVTTRWAYHALSFAYESKAKQVAEQLGEGWTVMDTNPQEGESARRMLNAIFDHTN